MNGSETPLPDCCDVAVVGGGTAGLSLAAALCGRGAGRVIVLEREQEAGGVPRHCGHYPFGVREYGRLMKGPAYARANVARARAAGAGIATGVAVTALLPGGGLRLITPAGAREMIARRVVLCTGVRESSRAQRLIGGDRPLGVVTTGALQAMVYLQGIRPFARPVILGSELVSLSAVQTCRHLGIRPLAMIEEARRPIVRPLFALWPKLNGIAVRCGVSDIRIEGRERVEGVSFRDRLGVPQRIEADGVIVSGHFRPEAALLRHGHLEIDPATGGPVTDQFGRLSDPAFYGAGNVLRAAETSGWCWREAVETASHIAADLKGEVAASPREIAIRASDPSIAYVTPQRIALPASGPVAGTLRVALATPVRGTLVVRDGERILWQRRINSVPVRRITFPLSGIGLERATGDVTLRIEGD